MADVDRWLAAFRASTLRVPGREPPDIAGLAAGILEALPDAGAPGGPELREVEKRWAFAGGTLAAGGASAFDVMALVTSLRDVVAGERSRYDWFAALALEGWAASRVDAIQLRYRESLERGTPVILASPRVPAALFVGEPDRTAVEATLSRLLLLAVRFGASAVLLDATGLTRPADRAVIDGVASFARHRELPKLAVVLVGIGADAAAAWRDVFPSTVRVYVEDDLGSAVRRAETVP